MIKLKLTKEQAMEIVEEFKALGGAFVDENDEDIFDEDGGYHPVVDHLTAESWLLNKLMST